MSREPKCGIGVMARAPSAGKTRLAPHLSPARLDALRRALLADTLEVVAGARAGFDDLVIFFTPAGSETEIAALAPPDFARVCQSGGDLGERMRMALEHLLLARGCGSALLVGCDIPLLGPAALAEARDTLRENGGVVLGPAEDGGYYLIGMSEVHAALFDGIEWGGRHVLADTMRTAAAQGIESRLIGAAYDVDAIEDLRRLEREIASVPADVARHVRRWLQDA